MNCRTAAQLSQQVLHQLLSSPHAWTDSACVCVEEIEQLIRKVTSQQRQIPCLHGRMSLLSELRNCKINLIQSRNLLHYFRRKSLLQHTFCPLCWIDTIVHMLWICWFLRYNMTLFSYLMSSSFYSILSVSSVFVLFIALHHAYSHTPVLIMVICFT